MSTPAPASTATDRVGASGRRRARHGGVLHSGAARGTGLAAAVVLLVAVCALSIAVGARGIPLATVWDAVAHRDLSIDDHVVVHTLRLPRTALGVLAGSALAVAGALLQGITRNPVADPGILGIEAGAALAVVLGIHIAGVGTFGGYVWLAFLGAAIAGALVFALAALGRSGSAPVRLALAGAVLAAMMTSITTAILLVDLGALEQFRFWVVGALAGRDTGIVWGALPFVVAGLVLSVGLARPLNTLSLGDDVATSLGQRVGLVRATALLAVVLLAGAATAACGPIAFMGLMVPHIARAIGGPDHRWLVPWCAVLGPVLLLSADMAGRLVARPGEVQVGILTALIGAPCFVALVRRRNLAEL